MQQSVFPFIAWLAEVWLPREPRPVIYLCQNAYVLQENGELAAYLCSGVSCGLCAAPRFALMARLVVRMCDSSPSSSHVGFLPMLSKKNQPTVVQIDRAAALMAHVSETTPIAEVPSLCKAPAWQSWLSRIICTISSYYLIHHLWKNVRLLSCKSAE